jgi:signal transduction histidine kinase
MASANDCLSRTGVLLSVEDQSIGIAANDIRRVFDRFYRGVMSQKVQLGPVLD